jgi:hypothetical protein
MGCPVFAACEWLLCFPFLFTFLFGAENKNNRRYLSSNQLTGLDAELFAGLTKLHYL